MKRRGIALVLGLSFFNHPAAASAELPPESYLGQTPPGLTPERFAPGVVSTDAVELNSVFAPDGGEFFFIRLIEGPDDSDDYPGKTRSILFHMVYDDGGWSEPVNLGPEINSDILDYCPMVTPDGKYLFFSRRRSDPPDGGWPRVAAGDVYSVDAAVIERLRSGVSDVEERT